jgi:hypothetical protein
MPQTLVTLAKLAGRKIETAQQALAKTQHSLAQVRHEITLQQQQAEEAFHHAAADDNLLELQAATAFQERIRRQLAQLAEIEAALVQQETQQRQQLQQHFAEQKRYELLHAQQQRAAAQKRAKKAQSELDETAGQLHRQPKT